MSTTTITDPSLHELATRSNGGLEVTLFWDRRDNSTSIELHYAATDQIISFRVPPGRALDAFYHPFAHLGNQLEHDLQPAQIDTAWRN
jgi:hypothetical protein